MPAQGYYDAEFNPWAQGMRRIGTMIAAQPVMQANAQARQQQAGLTEARMQTEGAQTRHYDASTAEITQGMGGRDKLGTALRILSAKPNDPAALADALEGAAQQMRHDPDGTMKAMGTVFGQLQAMAGNSKRGAEIAGPVEMEKNREDIASKEKMQSSRLITVPPGGAVIDQKDPSKSVFKNPSRELPGGGSYSEETSTYPAEQAVPGTPGTPGTPGYSRHVFGLTIPGTHVPAKPGTPGTPGTPYKPERTFKTRRRIGDATESPDAPWAEQGQPPDDSELPPVDDGTQEQVAPTPAQAAPVTPAAPAPVASAPSFAEKVRVIHPNGQTGMIPKAQLQAAMAQGYKLAQ